MARDAYREMHTAETNSTPIGARVQDAPKGSLQDLEALLLRAGAMKPCEMTPAANSDSPKGGRQASDVVSLDVISPSQTSDTTNAVFEVAIVDKSAGLSLGIGL